MMIYVSIPITWRAVNFHVQENAVTQNKRLIRLLLSRYSMHLKQYKHQFRALRRFMNYPRARVWTAEMIWLET